jgi:hypothetical protein
MVLKYDVYMEVTMELTKEEKELLIKILGDAYKADDEGSDAELILKILKKLEAA